MFAKRPALVSGTQRFSFSNVIQSTLTYKVEHYTSKLFQLFYSCAGLCCTRKSPYMWVQIGKDSSAAVWAERSVWTRAEEWECTGLGSSLAVINFGLICFNPSHPAVSPAVQTCWCMCVCYGRHSEAGPSADICDPAFSATIYDKAVWKYVPPVEIHRLASS